MRIFQDCLEMVKEVERDLFEMGVCYESETVQDKKLEGNARTTIELFGYAYMLSAFNKLDEMLDYMKSNKNWVYAEADERAYIFTGGDKKLLNPGEAWKHNASFWERFLRDGCFSYTYPERMGWQVPYIMNELKRRPNSRQAMVTIYSAERDIMNIGGRDRVPCSLGYQMTIRNGRLNMVYFQRSCDFLKFFASDVYLAMDFMSRCATELNIPIGHFCHFLGSLHAFKIDMEKRGIF